MQADYVFGPLRDIRRTFERMGLGPVAVDHPARIALGRDGWSIKVGVRGADAEYVLTVPNGFDEVGTFARDYLPIFIGSLVKTIESPEVGASQRAQRALRTRVFATMPSSRVGRSGHDA